MTFDAPQRPRRSCKVIPVSGRGWNSGCFRAETSPTCWLRARLLLGTLIVLAGCTPTTYSVLRDPPDYVDRVLEDVTAIVEGMANAHARDRVVYHDPGIRSSR